MGNSGNDRRIDNIEFTVSDIARSREFYGKGRTAVGIGGTIRGQTLRARNGLSSLLCRR